MKQTILLLSMLALTGCYSYVPVQSPQPGMEVRARLTADAAVRHSQGLDEPIVRYDGRVVAADGESVALDVLVARASSAFQDVTIRDTISLKRAELQSVLERKLSKGKSAIFALGMVAAAGAVVAGIDQIVGGTGGEGDDPGTPALREPFFVRIPFSKLLGWLTHSQ